MRRRIGTIAAVTAVCVMTVVIDASAQIYQLAELNTRQIQALDRQHTVVVIPGGILEEHGPYLPAYTDGYAIEAFARELSRAIVARPGWTVVVFPQIPIGNDPANTIGAKTVFPGSYPVRMATLRAMYMDLANEFGDQGFRWIFLVHDHGAPNHHQALNQASDYFHDTYGGTMVHLFGLKPVFLCCGTKDEYLSKEARAEEGFTVHAGADETSQLFFLRPDLIAPDFTSAPSLTARDVRGSRAYCQGRRLARVFRRAAARNGGDGCAGVREIVQEPDQSGVADPRWTRSPHASTLRRRHGSPRRCRRTIAAREGTRD